MASIEVIRKLTSPTCFEGPSTQSLVQFVHHVPEIRLFTALPCSIRNPAADCDRVFLQQRSQLPWSLAPSLHPDRHYQSPPRCGLSVSSQARKLLGLNLNLRVFCFENSAASSGSANTSSPRANRLYTWHKPPSTITLRPHGIFRNPLPPSFYIFVNFVSPGTNSPGTNSPRPQDGNGDDVALPDIGSVEVFNQALFSDGFETGDTGRWSGTS